MDNHAQLAPYISSAKARGQAPFLLALLDALEPLAPILASSLLIAQPLLPGSRRGGALSALAELLDEPDGCQALRQALADEAE